MTFEECLTASCCGREFPVCCELVWASRGSGVVRPRDTGATRQGPAAAPLQLQPFLLHPLLHPNHQLCPRFLLPACSIVSRYDSCSTPAGPNQLPARQLARHQAAGREILDAACRPCRHWQPAKSTAPTVVSPPMRLEICRAISQ